jgi:hypothetical protein
MARKTKTLKITPDMVMADLTGAWRSRTLAAGVELDVFSRIAAGKRTVMEIAEAAGASQRGMATLLDGLTAIGYLRKAGTRYSLQFVSAAFLLPGGKDYQGAMAYALSLTWDAWKNLSEAVKSGRPAETVNVAEKGKKFFPKLVASIFPGNFAAADRGGRCLHSARIPLLAEGRRVPECRNNSRASAIHSDPGDQVARPKISEWVRPPPLPFVQTSHWLLQQTRGRARRGRLPDQTIPQAFSSPPPFRGRLRRAEKK